MKDAGTMAVIAVLGLAVVGGILYVALKPKPAPPPPPPPPSPPAKQGIFGDIGQLLGGLAGAIAL